MKFQQLQRLIELGVVAHEARDHVTGKMFGIMARVWNDWVRVQSTVETSPVPVDQMAKDFLHYEYEGGPKPEWLQHMEDLG